MTRTIVKLLLLLIVFFTIAGASAYLTLTYVIESEETVVVPELKGKNAISVLELLSDLGLNTKVEESEFNPDVPRHHVIYQKPLPGATIKKGRDVKVVLSKGARTLGAPNLTGVSRQQAETILSNNGLATGVITKVFSRKVKAEMVIAQAPAPRESVTQGDRVNLLVSRGPRPERYRMPELEGMRLEKALRLIETYGLTVGRINSDHRKNRPANIVVEQEPLSGYYVEPEQEIRLTANRWFPAEDGKTGNKGETGKDILFCYQVPPGFLKQHIRLEFKAFGMTSILYDQLMKPGRLIWVMAPKYTHSVIFLYRNNELIETEVYNG